ncbi:small ribosomal subunit Rsm22 family protein [Streptomyces cheonanensis]|uniref:Small ribosomal subunit Rsm22 family protein n=1 Tax=Streptomyces cheonanensis TaxID=312720 RepID=A0ABP5G8T4_9ACTN
MNSTASPSAASGTSGELRAALERVLDGLPPKRTAAAVERLIASYRGRTQTHAPVLRDRADAVAYAAYRMPATYEAVSAALGELAARMPGGWEPGSQLDVGGGTGAALWAAAGVWPGARRAEVIDWAGPALDLGRELASGAAAPAVRSARWHQQRIGAGPDLPAADLVTVSYVLGELTEADRDALTDAAARAGSTVVLVEPGTPEGYLRIRAARDRLTAAGLRVVAPCPHSDRCPIEPGADWCHVAARVTRSALHRQVKGGVLPYEDEKFTYVAATTVPEAAPAPSRVVRKPQLRKGQVLLDLCTRDGALTRETVTKRHGDAYRAARDTAWGAPWPPPDVTTR